MVRFVTSCCAGTTRMAGTCHGAIPVTRTGYGFRKSCCNKPAWGSGGSLRRFFQRFPTVEILARAREQSVLAAWSGLGYYRRARMLHAAAKRIVNERSGRFPPAAVQFACSRELAAIPRRRSPASRSMSPLLWWTETSSGFCSACPESRLAVRASVARGAADAESQQPG